MKQFGAPITLEATDAMLMIAPLPRSSMLGRKARIIRDSAAPTCQSPPGCPASCPFSRRSRRGLFGNNCIAVAQTNAQGSSCQMVAHGGLCLLLIAGSDGREDALVLTKRDARHVVGLLLVAGGQDAL